MNYTLHMTDCGYWSITESFGTFTESAQDFLTNLILGNQGNVIATSERLLRRKFGSSRAIASSLLEHCRTTFQTKCYLRPQLMLQFRFCESTSVSSSDVTRADEDALIDRMMDSTVLQLIEKTCPQCPRFTVRLRTNVKHSNCVLQMA